MSQNSANTGATLNGIFRQVYNKEAKTAIPDFAILQHRVKFETAQLLGDKFHMPVVLSDEHGFTYGGSTAANYALNSAVAMQTQDAQISGSELTLQSGISYGAVSRAQKKGQQSVEQSVRLLMERMKASSAKRVELQLLYGQSATGIGAISAHSGSSTTRVYTISAATWAAGIWAGLENANLDVYSGSSKQNTNAAVVVTAVSVANKQISVSGNSTDLTAIDGASSPYFVFQGAFGNEMLGIDGIMTAAASYFNIDPTVYNLWQSQTFDCLNAEFSMGKILSGLALPVGRGLMEDVTIFCAQDSWANLNSDLGAQRKLDSSYSAKKGENGVESIMYHGQTGAIEIVCHPMVKQGEAFAFAESNLRRIGSTDVSFRGEGPTGEEDYLFQNQSTNGWTCRAYTDQATFFELPAQTVKFINIVSS